MKTKKNRQKKTNSSVPVIVLAIVIILALGGSDSWDQRNGIRRKSEITGESR